ncbi:MAG: hypothetical protein ACLTXT_07865 [Ruminococcus callidus]
MENIYCDGSHLSVTLRLTNLPEALQNSTGIESEFTGTLNGQKLSFIGSTGTYTMSTKPVGWQRFLNRQRVHTMTRKIPALPDL